MGDNGLFILLLCVRVKIKGWMFYFWTTCSKRRQSFEWVCHIKSQLPSQHVEARLLFLRVNEFHSQIVLVVCRVVMLLR